MADQQNLSGVCLLLKGFDNEMLSKVGHIDALDCIDAVEPARGIDQQIDDTAAAFNITRRRFNFNQCPE